MTDIRRQILETISEQSRRLQHNSNGPQVHVNEWSVQQWWEAFIYLVRAFINVQCSVSASAVHAPTGMLPMEHDVGYPSLRLRLRRLQCSARQRRICNVSLLRNAGLCRYEQFISQCCCNMRALTWHQLLVA